LAIAEKGSGVKPTYRIEKAADGTTSLKGTLNFTGAKEGSYTLVVKNGNKNTTIPLTVKPKPATP
jgi:hypothetical protein